MNPEPTPVRAEPVEASARRHGPFDKLRVSGGEPTVLGPFDKLRPFDRLTMLGPFDKLRANGGFAVREPCG